MFKMDGNISEEWFNRTRGILQGCAFSAILLALVMSIWVMQVKEKSPGAKPLVYVDDRLVRTQTDDEMGQALTLTEEFEQLIGAKWNVGKGRMCGVSPEFAEEWSRFGKHTDDFKYVGIHFDVRGRTHTHTQRERI